MPSGTLNFFDKLYFRLKKQRYRNKYARLSYSQEGEDMVLAAYLGDKKDGFYVDVGAHHPFRFSNTYRFYLQGWRGVNIDAKPGSMELFKLYRPLDINLEMAISNRKEILKFHVFNEPALNSFSTELSAERDNNNGYNVVGIIDIQTHLLADVLNSHITDNQLIDFMSVDVEGLDYNVLLSNDWNKFRPRYLLTEDVKLGSISQICESTTSKYLKGVGYLPISKTINTIFYKDVT